MGRAQAFETGSLGASSAIFAESSSAGADGADATALHERCCGRSWRSGRGEAVGEADGGRAEAASLALARLAEYKSGGARGAEGRIGRTAGKGLL